MDDRLLGIYLNDHLAGATGGVELMRRLTGRNRGTEYAEPLQEITGEIEEDRKNLELVMSHVGVAPNPVKITAARAAERVGRLKLNGRLLGYSPLSRLEELEAIRIGVEGKLALWRSLRETRGADPRLEGIDLEQLIARAERQRDRLEALRLRAAKDALGVAPARSRPASTRSESSTAPRSKP
jgi:hypothetical protein